MALIQTVHLSMANFKSAPVVPAVQNDTDRQIKMVIDDFDLTAGLTGKITFVRSDGTHYEASATLDTATNSFTADIDQALTQPGRTMVQLKVTDTLTVSTFSFVIFVEEDTSGTVTPQEGIDLVTAVEAAEDAADRAESAAETLELDATLTSPTKAAQAKAVGDEIGDLKSAFDSVADTELITPINLLNFNDPNYVDGKLSATYGTPTGTSGKTSGFIPVEEGKTYNYTYGAVFYISREMSRVCAYNSSKTYLSAYTQDNVRGFTVPENSGIAFIRFSGTATYFVPANNCMFTEGMPTAYSAYFDPYYKTEIKNTALDMDSTPTNGSTKPVESDGVYDALQTKQNILTFDDVPMSESTNPVKSGGVYNAISVLQNNFEDIAEYELIEPINLLNFSDLDFSTGTKLSSTTGNPTSASSSSTTGFIPVEEGKTYNFIYGIDLSISREISRICAYGSDKSYKSSYTQDNVNGFTVPDGSGIAYIRFSQSSTYLNSQADNIMFTAGFPDKYSAYFTPYYKAMIKDSALDTDNIMALGGEVERIFPGWELGSYNNSWDFTDSTNIIMSDYIPIREKLTVSVENGFTAKLYPFTLAGARKTTYPVTITDSYTITKTDAAFVRITYAKSTPETVNDPNTYGLGVTITAYGKSHAFDVMMSANPNAQDVDPSQVLPQYLALVAVKEKNVLGEIPTTVGYLYRTVASPYKLYYAQGKPDNIKYLCDWDSSLAGASHNTPIWYCFGMTDEGDIICVHRGEIEASDSARKRDNPIVYPHTDYAHPVLVELYGTKPTSWISNSGDYAEPGHFFFGEYIRSGHTEANVWEVTAPYTSASDWTVIKTYERDTDPSDPSSMVLGKIEHIHHVSRDPFSDILYVTTGDHHTEARIDYLDNGTWGILAEGDEEVCRQLNFIYTPTYVYWASDAFSIYDPETQQMVGGAHKFFRATRTAEGLIDLDNLERFSIPYITGSIATYHVSYIKDPECILILDRQDASSEYTELPFHVWNIKDERLEFSGQCRTTRGEVNQYLGFRCECCQHYPNLYDSIISVGFSLYPNSIDVCGNPNPAIIPSQGGVTASDSINSNQVNSMALMVNRK